MLKLQNLRGVAKPEYFFRPQQIGLHLWRELVHGRTNETMRVRLPWGLDINADLTDGLGWSLYTRALYETAVTETLWRVTRPGDVVVDGGANIGYMTSLLARRAGKQGRIYSFEPHPETFASLQRNVKSWEASGRCGEFHPHQAALGDRDGVAALHVPEYFAQNRGTSTLDEKMAGGKDIEVRVMTLDHVIHEDDSVGVIKLDVQGHEIFVLQGMRELLRSRRVRNIVFEEEKRYPAETHEFLRTFGYQIFGIEQHFTGIRFVSNAQPCCDDIELPNYLATIETDKTIGGLQSGLWQSFGPAQFFRWRE